jgi:hypothetical protein
MPAPSQGAISTNQLLHFVVLVLVLLLLLLLLLPVNRL